MNELIAVGLLWLASGIVVFCAHVGYTRKEWPMLHCGYGDYLFGVFLVAVGPIAAIALLPIGAYKYGLFYWSKGSGMLWTRYGLPAGVGGIATLLYAAEWNYWFLYPVGLVAGNILLVNGALIYRWRCDLDECNRRAKADNPGPAAAAFTYHVTAGGGTRSAGGSGGSSQDSSSSLEIVEQETAVIGYKYLYYMPTLELASQIGQGEFVWENDCLVATHMEMGIQINHFDFFEICSCGIYAFRRIQSVMNVGQSSVAVRVRLYGTIIEHADGYRGQYAEIDAVLVSPEVCASRAGQWLAPEDWRALCRWHTGPCEDVH